MSNQYERQHKDMTLTASLPITALSTPNESQIVASAKEGDKHAFKQLYELHHRHMYALCLRLCGDSQLAEEALQDAFVRAWQKLSLFDGKSQFGTWLHRLTVNQALSTLKKHRSFWARFIPIEAQFEPLSKEIQHENLDKLLLRLPERTRIVFVLFSIEGYQHDEIAKLLNIAVGTSKAQYHRAKVLLQELI